MTDQATNRYLKEIMLTAEIPKHISFHCARHTFATTCLTKGISIEIIRRYLGHNDRKTTLIYGKIETSVLIKEMRKLDQQD